MTHLSFVQTRARRNDSATSHEAAKAAVTTKSDSERIAIREAVKATPDGLTAREAGHITGIGWHETSRRISECGLTKTDMRRDGCAVWRIDHERL